MGRNIISLMKPCRRTVGLALIPFIGLIALGTHLSGQQPAKVEVLRIGMSNNLAFGAQAGNEDTANDSLRSFIKSETGFENEIVQQKDWKELAEKLAGGQLHLGVFQGFEFAWAREKQPKLKPLALAVNVHRYREAYVVVSRDSQAAGFAALEAQTVSLPNVGQAHLRLFAERQCQAQGKDLKTFFSKISTPDNFEDALDDVADGIAQAAVVDRTALEAYKRRKPARFNKLKEIAKSQPLPPPLVAYQEGVLDEATLKRFQEGLLNARRKERGQKLLNLSHLTGFETIPSDFDRILEETRKAYPPTIIGQ